MKKKSQAMNPQAMAAILRDPEGELLREILKLQEEADQEYRQIKQLVEKADGTQISKHTVEDLKARNIDIDNAGIKYEVVSDEVAEEADCIVCATSTTYTDDVKTVCAACFKPIVHRPHVPKRPPKLCLTCAGALTEEQMRALSGTKLPFNAPRFGAKPTIN